MSVYNSKWAQPGFLNHRNLQPKYYPQAAEFISQAIAYLCFPRHPSNQSSFRKRKIAWQIQPPTSNYSLQSECVETFSRDNTTINITTYPIITYKGAFPNFSYAFPT